MMPLWLRSRAPHEQLHYRLSDKVPFNAEAGKEFGDDADANEHFVKLHSIMSDGVGIPDNEAEGIS